MRFNKHQKLWIGVGCVVGLFIIVAAWTLFIEDDTNTDISSTLIPSEEIYTFSVQKSLSNSKTTCDRKSSIASMTKTYTRADGGMIGKVDVSTTRGPEYHDGCYENYRHGGTSNHKMEIYCVTNAGEVYLGESSVDLSNKEPCYTIRVKTSFDFYVYAKDNNNGWARADYRVSLRPPEGAPYSIVDRSLQNINNPTTIGC